MSRQTYNREGYFIARGLLPAARVDACFQAIHTLARQALGPAASASPAENPPFADMKTLFDQNLPTYLAAMRTGGNLALTLDLCRSPEIDAMARTLGIRTACFNTGPALHILSEELRVPGGYFGQAPHQDFSSTQASLNSIVAWIPLTDVDAHFFPVEIIPGSHRRGLWPGEAKQHYYEIDPALYREEDFIPMEMKRGDVAFLSAFVVHRSGQKGRPGARVAVSLRYEDAAEPTYAERGYPNAYKRSVERRIMHENFPSAEQLEALFGKP